MDALDGNVLAGALTEHFGTEMTTAKGACAFCGVTAQVAELCVYVSGPGTVARCPSCGNVVLALVTTHHAIRIHQDSFPLTAEPDLKP